MRHTQDPLADRHVGEHVVDQVRGACGHAPTAAARTETSTFARERDQSLGSAVATLEPREAAGEEPTPQKRPELVLDEPGNPSPSRSRADSTRNVSKWSRTTVYRTDALGSRGVYSAGRTPAPRCRDGANESAARRCGHGGLGRQRAEYLRTHRPRSDGRIARLVSHHSHAICCPERRPLTVCQLHV